ncbi:MAG TPA: hypothetical protein VFI29_21810 [Hanamia sp.]|nr:hypothetical protein [Hanamia sp.]
MKKILIILLAVTFSLGASAQKIAQTPHSNVTHVPRQHFSHSPRVHFYVVPTYYYGFDYGFPYYGYPFGWGYPYGFGYPYFPYRYRNMSNVLNSQIQSIRSEYSYKIKAARKDKSLTKAQRKQEILTLKSDREKDISIAEKNFRQQRMNTRKGMNNNQNSGINNNSDTNNNQNSDKGNQQNS